MSPIQQMLLGVGAVATKTYVDDVFSTYVYAGNSTARSINNGIDLSGEGGMLWVKRRNQSEEHIITDTVRGAANYIASSNADGSNSGSGISSFNSTGFSLGTVNHVNGSGHTYASWTFRKSPMFDVVTWDGNGTAGRVISHSLGSVPGLIMIKSTTDATAWFTYHRDLGAEKYLILNESNSVADQTWFMNDTAPTSTGFSVGHSTNVNGSGRSYVAYLFAGGEKGYNSVDFDGTGDKLSIANHSDLQIGSSTYTMEFWVYKNADTPDEYDVWAAKGSNANNTREFAIESMSDQTMDWYYATAGNSWNVVNNVSAGTISTGQWVHICAQKDSSGYFSFFVNGTRTYYSTTGAETLNTDSDPFCIGGYADANPVLESNVKISNFRFIKGTALYSSSFTPSTTPLTNVTNTKLLCCNGDLPTSSTVTPSTITTNGDPQLTWTSPFTSPDAVFGDAGDQNVIKTGSYIGNGNDDGPEINLGWEPQWLLIKQSDGTGDWTIFDSMRGIVTGGTENYLHPNSSDQETTGLERVDLTSTGFKLTDSGWINYDTKKYIFCALRRPDGYVGKPVELGTDVFAMDTGNSSSTIPAIDSGFPVDFALLKGPDTSGYDWYTGSRLTGTNYLWTNSDASEASSNNLVWDSNTGYYKNIPSSGQGWMWKRHAGFDVTAFSHNVSQGDHSIFHSLGKTPEMWWLKKRDQVISWYVWHKGLNGGTNTQDYYISLNSNGAEQSQTGIWGSGPTSTHMTLPDSTFGTGDYVMMFFASANDINGNPISKVGSYTGNGSNSGPVITLGFTPRLILLKRTDATGHWVLYDSARGLGGSGTDDIVIFLNSSDAQITGYDYFDMVGSGASAGFQHIRADNSLNASGGKYIYYCHA